MLKKTQDDRTEDYSMQVLREYILDREPRILPWEHMKRFQCSGLTKDEIDFLVRNAWKAGFQADK